MEEILMKISRRNFLKVAGAAGVASALSGREGLEKFVALIRGYFDQKGMHMQFNVVDRQTLLDAQEHPEKYKHLVVRVAGYSALFTTLSRSLQDDIIRRTEQGF